MPNLDKTAIGTRVSGAQSDFGKGAAFPERAPKIL